MPNRPTASPSTRLHLPMTPKKNQTSIATAQPLLSRLCRYWGKTRSLILQTYQGMVAHLGTLSYNRMKLLEIYSKTDVRNFVVPLPDTEETISLSQDDPAESLALTAPTAEETAILKGIDKGEITSSDEQVCKDDERSQVGSSEDVSENIEVTDSRHKLRYVDSIQVEQKRPRSATPCPMPANISDVLDDENLFGQIMGRINDTPSLIRAALVCKRWYRVCSDSKLVDEFCKRQPRRILGYFAVFEEDENEFLLFKEAPEQAGVARFLSVSLPQSTSQSLEGHSFVLEEIPELTCASCFLSSTFPEGDCNAMDYYNGHVLVKFGRTLVICHPLHQKVWMLPPLLSLPYWRGNHAGEYFLFNQDGLSAVHVTVTWIQTGIMGVDVACLNGDQWIHDSNSIPFEQPTHYIPLCDPAVLVNGCIYMLTIEGCLIEVTLEGCVISIIDLPSQAYYQWGSHQLSRAAGSDLLYVHVNGCNIEVWLYCQDSWVHCNTIHLPIVFASSNMSWTALDWDESRSGWGEMVTIYSIGDAAEFMFLGVSGLDGLYLLDVGSSTVVKVGEKTSEEKGELIGNRIIPFITSCAPNFPHMRENMIDMKILENAVVEGNKNLMDQLQLLDISLDEQCVKNFIETRYPSTANLIWSIDDCLTILHSVAALPAVEGGPIRQDRIHSCRRLTLQWEKYILQTSSMRKKVASGNSIYSQAEVNGQTVTWRSAHADQVAGDCVGFNLTVNLLIFYEKCLELLLESVNNRAGAFSKKRDARLVLIPNFQYSETIKRLRSSSDVWSLPT